jgi:prenylcysteine oxidase / farnesylcysteine lyase
VSLQSQTSSNYLQKPLGSTVVYPYDNTSLPELELGASIFIEADQNLWRASNEFNLTRRDFRGESYDSGIWDGQNILFSVCSKLRVQELRSKYHPFFVQFNGGWWDTAKMLWRYGYMSPQRTENLYENIINA